MKVCAGDWVEVLSKEDILRTLDKNGRLDGLPFMPQMFKYCGQRFRIYKHAYKTCDTVSGHYVGRSLQDGFHLNLRCDGQAYGGCQAGCLIFWKEAWLRPIEQNNVASAEREPTPIKRSAGCTEGAVWDATKSDDQPEAKGIRYACQATE